MLSFFKIFVVLNTRTVTRECVRSEHIEEEAHVGQKEKKKP